MKTEKECPFCRTNATVSKNIDTLQSIFSDCLCGKFIIDQKALEDESEYSKILKTDESKILFSGYLRNNQPTTITSEFINERLPAILDYCKDITLNDKISKSKRYLYKKTVFIGNPVSINTNELYTLFYLKHTDVLLLKIITRIFSGYRATITNKTVINWKSNKFTNMLQRYSYGICNHT